jgi:hypothetical protein
MIVECWIQSNMKFTVGIFAELFADLVMPCLGGASISVTVT